MAVDLFWTSVALPIAGGICLSFLIEQLLQPRPLPFWRRPLAALAIHVGLWLVLFALELSVFRRPWFAAANVLAILLFVVLVSGAKFHSLREPFIFQDFEYFSDALKHPRLYIPFLGWGRGLMAIAAFVLVMYAGMQAEPSLSVQVPVLELFRGVAAMVIFGSAFMWLGSRKKLPVTFDPETDLRQLGLMTSLWRYREEERASVSVSSAYDAMDPVPQAIDALPNLVVVQSESFFDARRLFSGVRSDVLREFDTIKASAVCQGQLAVSAWGANTVRTEFAFLSGLGEESLGVHRFNPYRKLARQGVPTIASFLKRLGYRTVCVHPYEASFYARDVVLPQLGFDELIDIQHFADVEKTGPYVGDVAVAEKVCALLKSASSQPIFVYVITMENHGPLHLEEVKDGDVTRLYTAPPPEGCEDLTIYLRHLSNADCMAGMLRDQLNGLSRPGWLCWFGDHVPIMPKVYSTMATPDGKTDYFIWEKGGTSGKGDQLDLKVENLSCLLLQNMGVARPRAHGPQHVPHQAQSRSNSSVTA